MIGSYLCPQLDALRDTSAREVLKNLCRRSDSEQLQLVLCPTTNQKGQKDHEALTSTETCVCNVFSHLPEMWDS